MLAQALHVTVPAEALTVHLQAELSSVYLGWLGLELCIFLQIKLLFVCHVHDLLSIVVAHFLIVLSLAHCFDSGHLLSLIITTRLIDRTRPLLFTAKGDVLKRRQQRMDLKVVWSGGCRVRRRRRRRRHVALMLIIHWFWLHLVIV